MRCGLLSFEGHGEAMTHDRENSGGGSSIANGRGRPSGGSAGS
jgi:hypothetical protein